MIIITFSAARLRFSTLWAFAVGGDAVDKEREIAFRAAKAGGAILKERLGNIKNIDYKSAFNIVTDVDKASEKEIIGIIREAFPDDQLLGEESGAHKTSSTRRWLIDPLDGTTNYTHSYPFFSVSIGFEVDGKLAMGAVYNPNLDELYWAQRGKGAWVGERQMRVSNNGSISTCLFATGFPSDSKAAKINNMAQFATVTDLSQGVRRDGSAALDLSFVACGRLDGFWELKLAPWDLAAGTIIVEEAGGMVTNLVGGPFDINSGHVVATNGAVHRQLLEALSFSDEISGIKSEEVSDTNRDVARK